jgi:hypothetical protein
MKYNPVPKKGDASINFYAYEHAIRQSNKVDNIRFDPQYFFVQNDPRGMYITMLPGNTTEEETGRWTISNSASNATSTTITVGTGILNIQGTKVEWAEDDVEGLGNSDFCYVYGIAARDGEGAISMAFKVDDWPTSSEVGNDNMFFVIGSINCATNTVTQFIDVDLNIEMPKEHMSLYNVIAMREYDETGALVDIGDETVPLPEGHYYEWTNDYVRAVDA